MHFSKSVIKKGTVAFPCQQGQPQKKMLDKQDTLDQRINHFVSSLSTNGVEKRRHTIPPQAGELRFICVRLLCLQERPCFGFH